MAKGVNPKDLIGVRKAPLRLVPAALSIGTAPVMALGARKYGPYNWRQYPVKLSVYLEAIERHYLAVKDGQWLDPESGEPHIFHISACVGIIADARANGTLVEDWPIHEGPAARMLADLDQSTKSATPSIPDTPKPGDHRIIAVESGAWEEELVQDDLGERWVPFQGEFGPIKVPAPEDKLPLYTPEGAEPPLDHPAAQVARRTVTEEADCE